MKYCTNCGNVYSKKICKVCGVKQNSTHSFCEWCGGAVDSNAAICVNCKEKIKTNKITSVIQGIISIIMILFFILSIIGTTSWISRIGWSITILFLIPFSKKIIRKLTFQKSLLRNIMYTCRIFIIGISIIIGASFYETQFEIQKAEATAAAEIVFHEKVLLKNEESFVLNDSDVTYEAKSDSDNIYIVWVEIDYSAENGFGGNNRDTYNTQLYFDSNNGQYYCSDWTPIY